MTHYGCVGRILHVDLTTEQISVESPPVPFYRTYLGGSAMGMHYVLNEVPPQADPMGPENVLALMVGVVTGAPISGQSRVCSTAKSPMSGLIGDAQGGGFWPAQLKAAGFDGIVLRGRASSPMWLWINEGTAELRSAENLWGKATGDVEDLIRDEVSDQRTQVLQCGPAAEKGVRFGALISSSTRANGRTGMGTVMASKNLRAIAVLGTNQPSLADPATVAALAKQGALQFPHSEVAGLGEYGTAEGLLPLNEEGGLPTRNWSSGVFEGAEKISGERLAETYLKRRNTCHGCIVRCKRVVEISDGDYDVSARYGGPEYETLAALGSYCGVDDLAAICYANQLCNMYGLDTISCGGTIAWAMDCFEQGVLDAEDTGGVSLSFGDPMALCKMVEAIAKREGFGELLGEGSQRAAEALGKGQDLVVATKGEEFPAHMPQHKRSLALLYSVNPFGADHQSHEHDPFYVPRYADRMRELDLQGDLSMDTLDNEKIEHAFRTQLFYSVTDSVCVCQFVFGPSFQLYRPSQLVELVRAVTGWDLDMEELLRVGERRLNMLRVFNAREGAGEAEDSAPVKQTIPLRGGPTDGVSVSPEELAQAKQVYYSVAGWDSEGVPKPAKLRELDLPWAIEMLPDSPREENT
jgi:aldehyde:ferredoxin oxidoreductase